MPGGNDTFFGLIKTPLVRGGVDFHLKNHSSFTVHSEMMLQICRDYAGLPDVRKMQLHEIRFFYEGLRAELKEHTKHGKTF